MIMVFRVVSAIGALIGVAWIIASPGYETILACIGALGVFLSTFIPSSSPRETVAASEAPALSARATDLLAEMEVSNKSKAKGISIMLLMGGPAGFYLPFIWSNQLHGPIKKPSVGDITDVIAAVSELERLGFLQLHHATKELRQYRRTERRP